MNNRLSSKALLRVITVFALVGFADTIYLTLNHYFGAGVKCLILEGCEVVLTSQYAEIYGIPLALMGLVFYTGIFFLASMAEIYQNNFFAKLLVLAGVLGFVASLVLLYLQIFIIRALCIYCLTSAISSTAIFITVLVLYKNIKIRVLDRSSLDLVD